MAEKVRQYVAISVSLFRCAATASFLASRYRAKTNASSTSISPDRIDVAAPQRDGNDSAPFAIDKSGDFFGQRLCVDCVFRQDDIVFCRKLHDVRPPLLDFLYISGDVADKFISGFAQTRNHDERYGEQKSHHDDGAQTQTDRPLQSRALSTPQLVPLRFQRPQESIH